MRTEVLMPSRQEVAFEGDGTEEDLMGKGVQAVVDIILIFLLKHNCFSLAGLWRRPPVRDLLQETGRPVLHCINTLQM